MCKKNDKYFYFVVFVALFLWLIAFFSSPLAENDFYRYLWEGRLLLFGGNPYLQTPQQALDLMHDRAAWQLFEQVAYPYVAAVYKPLLLGFFALCVFFFGLKLLGLKLLLAPFFLASLFLSRKLLANDPQKNFYLLGLCFSPLVLKEVLNSAHFDFLPIFFIYLSYFALRRQEHLKQVIFLAIAACFRFYPLIFLVFYWRIFKIKHYLLFIIIFLLGNFHLYLYGGGGLNNFADYWLFNPSLFAVFFWLGQQLSLPLIWLKYFSGFLTFCSLFGLAYLYYRSKKINLAEAHLLAIFALLLFSAVVNPWYLLWFLPFALLSEIRPLWRLASYYWSFSVFLSYYYWLKGSMPLSLVLLEYLPVYLLLILGFLPKLSKRLPPLFSAS